MRVPAIRYGRTDYGGDRFWDHDVESGERLPNPWVGLKHLPTVNKMTVRHFRSTIRASAVSVRKYRLYSYGTASHKSRVVCEIGGLIPLSICLLNEFFARVVVCVLQKPW